MSKLCCSSSLFALLCAVLLLPRLPEAFSITDCEYNSLKDLFDATNGVDWRWQGATGIWNFSEPSSDPCLSSWQGVNCTTSGSKKTLRSLDLSGYNLDGTLPETFFPCSEAMIYLNLTFNNIVGRIPLSLVNITQLIVLDLYNNFLTGTIPSTLCNLTQLQYLNFGKNFLTRTIPSALSDLIQLQWLDLAQNSLTGTIPPTFGNLIQLQWLDLGSNYLTGTTPSTFGNLIHLNVLGFQDNSFTGIIPSTLGNLTNLYVLNLHRNFLSGTIPSTLGNLLRLQYLTLYINSLNGTIPSTLGNLLHLQFLDFQENAFTGTIPLTLGNLTQLKGLNLGVNSLTGTIPSTLAKLSKLNLLDLGINSFSSGTIPVTFGALKQLQILILHYNNLTGPLPAFFGNLTQLQVLNLGPNSLIGTIPSALGNLVQMQLFDIYGNSFTGTIPTSLGKLIHLEHLGFSHNFLNGTIPSIFGNLTQLQLLYLGVNALSGRIPSTLGKLTKLQLLGLGNNTLTGTIPSTLGNLKLLQALDLSNNRLISSIPQSFKNIKAFIVLLNNNLLTGIIPDMSSFGTFDVSNNFLTGKIPSSLFGKTNMTLFSAAKNCLSVEFPSSICEQTSLKTLILNGVGGNKRCFARASQVQLISFPSCIWSMKSLQALYIAGNGLRGNLQYFEMDNLAILNVNTNRFTGTLSSNFSNHAFREFDISSNQITGYLNIDFALNEIHDRVLLHADVNRLSGKVNYEVINMYESVQVLSGTSISCKTLPSVDSAYVDSPFFSDCETRKVYFSIILWCITLGSILAMYTTRNIHFVQDVILWFQQHKNIFGNKSVELLFPKTIQLITSLQKLHKLIMVISLSFLIVLVAVYGGFEFSKDSNTKYKVLFEKYNYAFSGIFLKSVPSAVVLLILYTIASVLFVYIVCHAFVFDWTVLRNSKIFVRSVQISNMYTYIRFICCRYTLLVLFLGISLTINYLYVLGLSKSANLVFLLQIGFAVFNILYQSLGTTLFLSMLLKQSLISKADSVFFHSIIMTFSGVVHPCLATLVIDSNCFRDYIFDRAEIVTSYPIKYCAVSNILTQSCLDEGEELVRLSFTPPFIYGHRCRDAVFGNYIPIIILSCAFSSFIYPFLYMSCTKGIQSLNSPIVLFTVQFNAKDLILEANLVYIFERIILNLVLMMMFGIAYPFCLLLLAIDNTSRIYLLVYRLYLYVKLYKETRHHNAELEKENSEYLEDIISEVVLNAPYLIWPGLGAASVVFGLYLFDMAWDSAEDEKFGVPIALLILNIVIFSVLCTAFFKAKHKSEADLAARILSSHSNDDRSSNTSRITPNRPDLDFECRVLTMISKNPIQRNDDVSS